MDRRVFLLSLPAAVLFARRGAARSLPAAAIYRDPGCGCCEAWAAILQANGFAVTISDDPDRANRLKSLGIAPEFSSCHTAMIGPWAIEGHVPVREILRLLDERPAGVIGLAVPGMPNGSPGMGPPEGGDPYDVLLLGRSGRPRIFARY